MVELDARYKRILIDIIRNTLPTARIILFGSRATGKAWTGSDIDLALDNHGPVPLTTLSKLRETIEESLVPYTVDLVDISMVDAAMRSEITKKGIEWSD